MTHMARHIVVAPILSAPLLTDECRSTVGSGTREDFVTLPDENTQFVLVMFNGPDMYVAFPAGLFVMLRDAQRDS